MTVSLEIIDIYNLPVSNKREDTFHASLIGVVVLSLVIHLLAGMVFFALIDVPETQTPPPNENVVHHVTLLTPQPKPEPLANQKSTQDKKATEQAIATSEKKEIEKALIEPSPIATIPYIKELEVSKASKDTVSSKTKHSEKKPVKDNTEQPSTAGKTVATDKITQQKGVVNYGDNVPKNEPDISQQEKERILKAINECLNDNFERILSLWIKPGEFNKQLSGVVKITLDHSGNIIEARISRSSGSLPLDLSVVEAIQRAKRFSPPSIGQLPLNFNFDFESDMR